MKRLRRYFRIAWIAQLAFVVLALPAAHVHRHAPGECCGSVCSSESHDHGSCASHDHASHDHGTSCSHDSSCSHSHAAAERQEIARVPGEQTLEESASHEHCAACELTRLIGHGFTPDVESLVVVSSVESTPSFVATCFGRELESRGCRGPPVAC